ncbi:hypothetical protein DSO57_1001409 [Entomophthora muscae]|uniref:Uncharacterized protein n=1 Tax=Entomophthora muscae TaxID=34485 RepID=A0ACC2TJN2_9FUNG|nr:hypothetical protein DSO57_1001409 [Entomophthora muscae]
MTNQKFSKGNNAGSSPGSKPQLMSEPGFQEDFLAPKRIRLPSKGVLDPLPGATNLSCPAPKVSGHQEYRGAPAGEGGVKAGTGMAHQMMGPNFTGRKGPSQPQPKVQPLAKQSQSIP